VERIVVLGGGESGAGAAVLAKAKGFDVFVSDFSSIKPKYKEMLDTHGIRWEEGRHTEADILNADEIIKSPGIPDKAPIIQKLKAQGTHIISEIEFAGRYTDSKMICITGSNGKTTTTMLTYHILKEAGLDVGLAGNVGNSLALQVAEEPHAVYVIELSRKAINTMEANLANSEGWNCIPNISSQRCASLALIPTKGVTSNISTETGSNNINAGKNRHGTLCNSKTSTNPPSRKVA